MNWPLDERPKLSKRWLHKGVANVHFLTHIAYTDTGP